MRVKEVWNVGGICVMIITICFLVIGLRFLTSSLPYLGVTVIAFSWLPLICGPELNGWGFRRFEYPDDEPTWLQNRRQDADLGALVVAIAVVIITILVWVIPVEWSIELLRWRAWRDRLTWTILPYRP